MSQMDVLPGSAAGLDASEVAQGLGVVPAQGLSADEAARRLQSTAPTG